jgi:hypothetical protein
VNAEEVHLKTRAQWRDWLAAHHDTDAGVWLVSWKRHTGRPAVGYDDAVCEALAFGWIDSVRADVRAAGHGADLIVCSVRAGRSTRLIVRTLRGHSAAAFAPHDQLG